MSEASVSVDGEVVGAVGAGLCVLLGVTHGDDVAVARKMAAKLWTLRLFDGPGGRMDAGADETGLPYPHLSRICAMSAGINYGAGEGPGEDG